MDVQYELETLLAESDAKEVFSMLDIDQESFSFGSVAAQTISPPLNTTPSTIGNSGSDDDGPSTGKRARGRMAEKSEQEKLDEKRRKNREAAKLCRDKKKEFFHDLEQQNDKLVKENMELKRQQQLLSSENSMLKRMIEMFSVPSSFPSSFYPSNPDSAVAQIAQAPKSASVFAFVFSVAFFSLPSQWSGAEGLDPHIGSGPAGRVLLSHESAALAPASFFSIYFTPRVTLVVATLALICTFVLWHNYRRRKQD